MNRRNFLKLAGSGLLVAAAPEILVPEKRFFFLDRTMIPPQGWGAGWTIVRQGPSVTGHPWEEISIWKPTVPGSGFMIMVDSALGSREERERFIAEDILTAIANQEAMIAAWGTLHA